MRKWIVIGIVCWKAAAQQQGKQTSAPPKPATTPPILAQGCVADGITDDTACLRNVWAVSARKSVTIPPGQYYCADPFKQALLVDAATVYAEGATFLGCIFTTVGATGGLNWVGGTFDTTAITGNGGPPIWQVSRDHTTFVDTRFLYTKNYTAIQIGGSGGSACPDDVSIEGIKTTANGESHITPACVSNLRINNWLLDGTGHEDGIAIMGLTGPSHDITISNVTATNTYNILKIVNGNYPISNVSLSNWTCTDCVTPIYLQGDVLQGKQPNPFTNVNVSHGTVIDLTGTSLTNLVYISSTGVPMRNVTVSDVEAFGRFNNSSGEAGWIRFYEKGGAVFDHFAFRNLTLVTAAGDSGSFPLAVVFGSNDVPWTNFQFRNISTNGSTRSCLSINGVTFAAQSDLTISDSHFSGCASSNHALPAHMVNGRVVWERNQTILYATQPELQSVGTPYPTGLSYGELTKPEYSGSAPGTTVYCYDCAPTNPPTAQNPALGGAMCMHTVQGHWACSQSGGLRFREKILTYANNDAARAGGLTSGEVYKTPAGVLMVAF
jgi:hypothetical protein